MVQKQGNNKCVTLNGSFCRQTKEHWHWNKDHYLVKGKTGLDSQWLEDSRQPVGNHLRLGDSLEHQLQDTRVERFPDSLAETAEQNQEQQTDIRVAQMDSQLHLGQNLVVGKQSWVEEQHLDNQGRGQILVHQLDNLALGMGCFVGLEDSLPLAGAVVDQDQGMVVELRKCK